MTQPRLAQPRLRTLLWRGIRGRCPNCGGRGVFASWFKLTERCPTCDHVFIHEEGFWLGAYVINFGLGEAGVGILLIAFMAYKLNHPEAAILPWLVGGAILAVVMPLLLFPISRTIWAAIDLAMRRAA